MRLKPLTTILLLSMLTPVVTGSAAFAQTANTPGSPAQRALHEQAQKNGARDGHDDGLAAFKSGASSTPTTGVNYQTPSGYNPSLGPSNVYERLYRQAYQKAYRRAYNNHE